MAEAGRYAGDDRRQGQYDKKLCDVDQPHARILINAIRGTSVRFVRSPYAKVRRPRFLECGAAGFWEGCHGPSLNGIKFFLKI